MGVIRVVCKKFATKGSSLYKQLTHINVPSFINMIISLKPSHYF